MLYFLVGSLEYMIHGEFAVSSEYVVGFSGAAFQSYSTRMQTKEAYVAFFEHQNELRKSEQVTQKVEDVAKNWCWKDWVILVQFVVIAVLWYKIM
jgi:hypothetical protein